MLPTAIGPTLRVKSIVKSNAINVYGVIVN